MRTSARALAATALCSIAAGTPASAQDGDVQIGHAGFHASIGVGMGQSTTHCLSCSVSARTSGPTLTMRFGGALAPNVVLSAEYTAQAQTSDLTTAVALWTSLVVQWYPRARQGFFVNAGGGFALHNEDIPPTEATSDVQITVVEWGYQFGAGYDIRMSRGSSITPFADVLIARGTPATVSANGAVTAEKVGAYMVHAGVAVSWR
jgi:hypothetical protein